MMKVNKPTPKPKVERTDEKDEVIQELQETTQNQELAMLTALEGVAQVYEENLNLRQENENLRNDNLVALDAIAQLYEQVLILESRLSAEQEV